MSTQAFSESGVPWLSKLPAHWKVLRACRIFIERREAGLDSDEQLSATQKYGVVPQKLYIQWEQQKVVLALKGIENFKHVNVDDFVISLRSFEGGIERCKYSGCVSPAYTVLQAVAEIDSRYWAYLMKSAGFIGTLQSLTDGIREGKNISYQQFGQMKVPFPPIIEQRRIADFLESELQNIDLLVAEQARAINFLVEKRSAIISHAVTKGLGAKGYHESGVPWLNRLPAHWKVLRACRVFIERREAGLDSDEQLSATQKYGVVPQKLYMQWEKQKVVLALKGIENFKHVNIDDFVISLRSFEGGIERCKYTGCVSPAYTVLQAVEKIDSRYWAYLMKSAGFIGTLQSLTDGIREGKNISYQQFGQMKVPCPPFYEQVKVADFLDSESARIDLLIAEQEKMIKILEERRSALISAAVTGKIDVRGYKGRTAA